MKRSHRKIHRVIWSVLPPVLFLAVLLLSNPTLETMPVNESVPGLNQPLATSGANTTTGATSDTLEYRVLP